MKSPVGVWDERRGWQCLDYKLGYGRGRRRLIEVWAVLDLVFDCLKEKLGDRGLELSDSGF